VFAGPVVLQQLESAAVQLVQVALRKQAADMQLAADAYAFARQQQQQQQQAGCIVCVSGDSGGRPAKDAFSVMQLIQGLIRRVACFLVEGHCTALRLSHVSGLRWRGHSKP
jgi:hypothetical protein